MSRPAANSGEIHDLLVRYCEGDLAPDEVQDFERLASADPALMDAAEEYMLGKILCQTAFAGGRPGREKSRWPQIKSLAGSLAALLILSLGVWLWVRFAPHLTHRVGLMPGTYAVADYAAELGLGAEFSGLPLAAHLRQERGRAEQSAELSDPHIFLARAATAEQSRRLPLGEVAPPEIQNSHFWLSFEPSAKSSALVFCITPARDLAWLYPRAAQRAADLAQKFDSGLVHQLPGPSLWINLEGALDYTRGFNLPYSMRPALAILALTEQSLGEREWKELDASLRTLLMRGAGNAPSRAELEATLAHWKCKVFSFYLKSPK